MMMFDYIKKYGNISFSEKEFNDIDAIILSCLSYIEFDNIVPTTFKTITLKAACTAVATKENNKIYKKRVSAIRDAFKMAKMLITQKRYQNILLYNYSHILNNNEQFGAISMNLGNGTIFISYEGTDHNMVGWYEDLIMGYTFPVPAQKDAVRYLNRAILFKDKKVIIAGHSKGGNLALIAGMNANIFIRHKITTIYNFDGPGLRKKQIDSNKYKKIENKLRYIIPKHSVVGLMLRHGKYEVVKTKMPSIVDHSPYTWMIENDKFIPSELSTLSKRFEKGMIKWLDHHDDEERKYITDAVINIFEISNIKELNDIMSLKSILTLVKNSNALDKETKDLIKNYLVGTINYLTKRQKEE